MNIPNDTTFRHAATELVEKILKCKAQADEPNQGQVWVRFTRNETPDAVLVYYDRKNGGCWFCYNGKFFFS